MSRALFLVAMLALSGCGDTQGAKAPITMTVIEIYEDTAPLGCMGTNWNTFIRSEDNRVAKLCGRWGKPGDKIAGCWMSGHWDPIQNGFRKEC